MSYSRTMYIGWFAIVKPNVAPVQVGVIEKRSKRCTNNASHKQGDGSFCSVCGSRVETLVDTKPKMQGMGMPCHWFDETDPEELAYQTAGAVTLKDLEAIKGSHAIFPEFLQADIKSAGKHVIMAPGYMQVDDLARSDTEVHEFTPQPIDAAWFGRIRKMFNDDNAELKFGAVVEVM